MITSDPPSIDTAISDSQLYPLKRGLMILKTDLRSEPGQPFRSQFVLYWVNKEDTQYD